jgi:hypothetical protein
MAVPVASWQAPDKAHVEETPLKLGLIIGNPDDLRRMPVSK